MIKTIKTNQENVKLWQYSPLKSLSNSKDKKSTVFM